MNQKPAGISGTPDEGYSSKPGPSVHEGIDHIIWAIEHSPKTYEAFRDRLIDLRVALVNAELRHRELNQTEETQ